MKKVKKSKSQKAAKKKKKKQAVAKKELWQPAFLDLIRIYRTEGDNYIEIAEKLGVSIDTFYFWKREKDELFKVCEEASKIRDKGMVSIAERGIVKRAKGYMVTETKQTVEQIVVGKDKNGKEIIGTRTKQSILKKEVEPDVNACKSILRSRNKERWGDNPEDEEFELTIELVD